MPARLFLDANVIFTATISPQGSSRALLDLAQIGACKLLASPFAVDEARRNVGVKYPDDSDTLEGLLVRFELVAEASQPLITVALELLPAKDAPILAAALAAEADFLVTGDRRHFANLFGRTIEGVTVLPPRQALELLLGP